MPTMMIPALVRRSNALFFLTFCHTINILEGCGFAARAAPH